MSKLIPFLMVIICLSSVASVGMNNSTKTDNDTNVDADRKPMNVIFILADVMELKSSGPLMSSAIVKLLRFPSAVLKRRFVAPSIGRNPSWNRGIYSVHDVKRTYLYGCDVLLK